MRAIQRLNYRKYQQTFCDYEEKFVDVNSIIILLLKHDRFELVKYCKKHSINWREIV